MTRGQRVHVDATRHGEVRTIDGDGGLLIEVQLDDRLGTDLFLSWRVTPCDCKGDAA